MKKLIVSICSVALLLAGTESFAGGPKRPGKPKKPGITRQKKEKEKNRVERAKRNNKTTQESRKAVKEQSTNRDLLQNHERVDRSEEILPSEGTVSHSRVAPRTGKPLAQVPQPNKQRERAGAKTPEIPSAQTQLLNSGAINAALFEGQEKLAQSALRASQSVHYIPDVGLEKHPDLKDPGDDPKFSLTTVKKEYNGKVEIYGLLPTHALPQTIAEAQYKFGVTKNFEFPVTTADGTVVSVKGEVVQVAPESMGDVSLVKFDPKYEHLLKPVEYVTEQPQVGQTLFSFGYANGRPAFAKRVVKENSQFSIRTNIIEVEGDTRRYCGGLVFNEKGQGVGIHIGSTNRTSYAVPARFIDKLIEAYHNDGKAKYDLKLNDHTIASLNVDEYISVVSLADDNLNIIYQERGTVNVHGVVVKFSENHLNGILREYPDARFLVLQSRTLSWKGENEGGASLFEDADIETTVESKAREHIFDLRKNKIFTTQDEPDRFVTDLFGDDSFDGVHAPTPLDMVLSNMYYDRTGDYFEGEIEP